MVKGNKKDVEKMEEELKMTPVTFGDFTMKRKVKDKYLGQILHEDGLEARTERASSRALSLRSAQ